MRVVKLYDCLPSRNLDLHHLSLGWCAYTKAYVKQGTILYKIKYSGYNPFSVDFAAPQDGFYVHNGLCLDHAKWFDWGHTDKEPILCEIWETIEEFENSTHTKISAPKYGISFTQDKILTTNIPNTTNTTNNSESCHTYLMKDDANGYYKIGMSKNPTYRERTLQSDKPTITLICSKEFSSRTEASELEKYLHKKYANKRERGEWFRLSEQDIINIKESLK